MPALLCSPASVHFGGFKPGVEHTAKVRITNVSTSTVKLDILSTASEHFSIVEVQKQLPKLAPGISESVTIRFRSEGLRYFYDFFKVNCSNGEQVQVDLHAYPVGVSFHSRFRLQQQQQLALRRCFLISKFLTTSASAKWL